MKLLEFRNSEHISCTSTALAFAFKCHIPFCIGKQWHRTVIKNIYLNSNIIFILCSYCLWSFRAPESIFIVRPWYCRFLCTTVKFFARSLHMYILDGTGKRAGGFRLKYALTKSKKNNERGRRVEGERRKQTKKEKICILTQSGGFGWACTSASVTYTHIPGTRGTWKTCGLSFLLFQPSHGCEDHVEGQMLTTLKTTLEKFWPIFPDRVKENEKKKLQNTFLSEKLSKTVSQILKKTTIKSNSSIWFFRNFINYHIERLTNLTTYEILFKIFFFFSSNWLFSNDSR